MWVVIINEVVLKLFDLGFRILSLVFLYSNMKVCAEIPNCIWIVSYTVTVAPYQTWWSESLKMQKTFPLCCKNKLQNQYKKTEKQLYKFFDSIV